MRRTSVALVLPVAGALIVATTLSAAAHGTHRPAGDSSAGEPGDSSLETATAVRNLHVVTHGIDVNGNGEYDMAAGPSELDATLPQEATAPASCGIIEGSNISAIPAGGVDTGVGPLTGTGNGAVAGPQVLAFSAIVGIGALWVIGAGLRRQQTALR
jgi:hypothetical protein